MKKQTETNSMHDKTKNSSDHSEAEITSSEEKELQNSADAEITPESKLEAELTEANDKYLRMYSDFENYKKRVARDRIELTKMANADVFLSIIPVMDDMERALKAMEDTSEVKTVKEGINLIYNKLVATATSKGLKAMDSIGKPFDTELHDAITNVPAGDGMKGKVVDEVEKGYFLNDKVIRHAKVIVGN